MISDKDSKCPDCGGYLKYYDSVSRLVRTKGGHKQYIKIRRMRCNICNKTHRELPSFICPYKHYESEIIDGVVRGFISSDVIGFEDYPCELTMLRWARKSHLLIRKEECI